MIFLRSGLRSTQRILSKRTFTSCPSLRNKEADTERKYPLLSTISMTESLFFDMLGAERTMQRFWKKAGVKEDKGNRIWGTGCQGMLTNCFDRY
jgi:hypothetical protein